MQFIDLQSQLKEIRSEIDAAIARVFDHGMYILGPEVAELEEKLANYVGVDHCISVSSGTDALLMALMAIDVGPGDEVITVPYTWISTAEVVALLHAKPVFVDIEPDTWNIDPDKIEEAITKKTKAILPVGIYGQTANLCAINEIAARYGIPVIEDAAQCFGATHFGTKSCSLTELACTSFFPTKPLGCYGDGGAIFTKNGDYAKKLRQIRNHGQLEKHNHPILGLNGRFDTMKAATLLVKLRHFDADTERRRSVAQSYFKALADSNVVLPIVRPENVSVWAQFTILSEHRDELQTYLANVGIPSVPYYAVPLHLQKVFQQLGHKKHDFPVTERVAQQCLSLPMNPLLTQEEIERVAQQIHNFFYQPNMVS